MESLGVALQERTSIFTRLDAVVWKCRVHCILQRFALPGFGITQIVFLQPFPPSQTMPVSTNHRGKKGCCPFEQTVEPFHRGSEFFFQRNKGAYGFRHMFQEGLAKSGCLFFLPVAAGILQ